MGRNASINQVLEDFESAGCERNGTIGIKGGRVTMEAELQSGKVQGDGQHCTPGGEPLSGWKHGARVKGVPGVKEVERQLLVPCDEPRFEEPRVER